MERRSLAAGVGAPTDRADDQLDCVNAPMPSQSRTEQASPRRRYGPCCSEGLWVLRVKPRVAMSPHSDGQADEGLDESFAFAEVEWSDDVVELSDHLSRLWRLGGDEKMTVGEMHNVRAALFGYGNVLPND